MSDMVPPTTPTRETLRRLKASIGAAAGFDEFVAAVQGALRPLFPPEPASLALSGQGDNQSVFASLPNWGSNRWVADPVASASKSVRTAPVRTGELPTESVPAEPELVRTGELPLERVAANPVLVRTGELVLDPPAVERGPDDPTEPLVPAPAAVDPRAAEDAADDIDSRARWRAVTQLMTLLLAGQEPAQLLSAALRLSIQTFSASGALIHLSADDIVPGERGFALGEPGFEAALRATARQRRGLANVSPSETLAGRYPHRLVVPISSAHGELGKYALFRAAPSGFGPADREDARAVATLLAVALHQYRLTRI